MKLLGRILVIIALVVGIVAVTAVGFGISLTTRLFAATNRGPQQLAAELLILRREGAPTTPAELQQPLPPNPVNAALDYKRLKALLAAKPLTAGEMSEVDKVGQNDSSTPAQDAAVSRLLDRRTDVMDLVYRAARKPKCVFVRDWSQTIHLNLSDYKTMRQAVNLIRAKSYLLAKSGRYREAIATDALGFRVADQVGHEPILISYLVDIACDNIALMGMNQILQFSGANADVADEVRTTIANDRPSIDLRRATGGEVPMDIGSVDPAGAHATVSASSQYGGVPSPGLFDVWKTGHQNKVMDAMLAIAIHYQRRLLETTSLPESTRRVAYDKVIDETTHLSEREDKYLDLASLANVLLPIMTQAADKEYWAHAQERVVMAGAAVLAYRARHGAYPDRLDQATPNLPLDPFTQKPLMYRREPYGFIVYSAGPTGHFDGRPGHPHEDKEAFFRYPVA